MMPKIIENNSVIDEITAEIIEAQKLHSKVLITLKLAVYIAKTVLEHILCEQGAAPTEWPSCPICSKRLHSKGLRKRQITTLFGIIRWRRQVGRCPNKCEIGYQIAPFDDQLGLKPRQATSMEVKQMACALAIFVPYNIASQLLKMLTGVDVSQHAIWDWVQDAGTKFAKQLEQELEQFAQGKLPEEESMPGYIADLPLIMGADGVMAPFRPMEGTPAGKTQWREVKVGILARIRKYINSHEKERSSLEQRRLVAVLSGIDDLASRVKLEALKQGLTTAKQAVWVCDGGKGFWNLYATHLSEYAIGILDFYHASGNLWKGVAAWLDGRKKIARESFDSLRHKLRHGEHEDVLSELAHAIIDNDLSPAAQNALVNLFLYLENHIDHIDYEKFKEMGLPIGSGIVESACKWLIQQRFKGVGMRWSENGFNNLLHLRLAWVNGRFEENFMRNLELSPNA